jgi:hypothetical protein
VQLRSTVAAERAEDVAGEALAVHPHQNVGLTGHLPFDQGHMMLPVEHRFVGVDGELAVVGGDPGVGDPAHELVLVPAVPDQIGDRDQMQPVLGGELGELGEAGHARLVLTDHLAQHADRRHPGGPGQVDRGLGVTGALEHATGSVAQREDVPGRLRSDGRMWGSASALMVAARSAAEIPVEVPWR